MLLAAADGVLASGDPRAALRALVSSGVYLTGDTQTNARVCQALLALDDATSAERFDGLAFLSRFLSQAGVEYGSLSGMRCTHPVAHLPEAAMDAVRHDAGTLLALASVPLSR